MNLDIYVYASVIKLEQENVDLSCHSAIAKVTDLRHIAIYIISSNLLFIDQIGGYQRKKQRGTGTTS